MGREAGGKLGRGRREKREKKEEKRKKRERKKKGEGVREEEGMRRAGYTVLPAKANVRKRRSQWQTLKQTNQPSLMISPSS